MLSPVLPASAKENEVENTSLKPHASPTPQVSAVRDVYQFPNGTSLENMAIRANGNLLVNVITSPDIYQVNPFNPANPSPVHSFPGNMALLGITEVEPDVFAVIVGNFSAKTIATIPGSYSVWRVDMRSFGCEESGKVQTRAAVSKIASIPEGQLLNGMTHISQGSPYVLIADSGLGAVFRLNVKTGQYKIAISDLLMKPEATGVQIGVNGVHISGSNLYFTNSILNGGFFAKIPIHLSGPDAGTATGKVEIVAAIGGGDDFTINSEGNAYVANVFQNLVQHVTPDGQFRTIAGAINQTILEGVTSVQFGRTAKDKNILYATTNGGLAGTVPGTFLVGGKVVALDVSRL
ncbi:quino protein amine dehydrogenase beta chain-like protein [Halenospora varia]|nr:quino protein amine dehydrogenase beta chain-like protein [Halenospora varia]